MNIERILFFKVPLICLLVTSISQLSLPIHGVAQEAIDYSAELPRYKPLSTAEALASFEVLDGFEMQLVAAEPLVEDPIAFAFDARSRLFVIEMRDYSEQDTECLGRVALLVDEDGDGKMDSRTTFKEGLSWPTAIWPWKDGVLVAAPPKLTWYRDTDDDGVSDKEEEWYEGFGRSNVQGMTNSLRWGVDGLIHGATSSTGAKIATSKDEILELRKRDFSIDPRTKAIRSESGGGQHGLSFNRWGDKFVTSNSDHLQQVVDLEEWLSQYPPSVSFPSTRKSIAEDGRQAPVYRASPVEPWRIVRTRLRVGGVVSGPVEGGGRAAGYFTGATGTWIVDGEAGYGPSNEDIALVCDVGSNLIHRKSLTDTGIYWTSDRIDEERELVRSRDTWFRPVQLGDGPDGAVYIADMYREVIEHPKSLPPMIKQHLDLTSGRDRGRIWRLVRKNRDAVSAKVDFTRLTEAELFAELQSKIRWRRSTASQTLSERGLSSEAIEQIQSIVHTGNPEAVVIALHLASQEKLTSAELFRSALRRRHERVTQHVLAIAQRDDVVSLISDQLLGVAASSQSPRVNLELAKILPSLESNERLVLLTKILPNADQQLVQAVLANSESELRQLVRRSPEFTANLSSVIQLLIPNWVSKSKSDPKLKTWLLETIARSSEQHLSKWLDWISSIRNKGEANQLFGALFEGNHTVLEDFIVARLSKSEKLGWIVLLDPESQGKFVEAWLADKPSESQQEVSIEVSRLNPRILPVLWDNLGKFSSKNRAPLFEILASSNAGLERILAAIAEGEVDSSEVPMAVRTRAFGSTPEIRDVAEKIWKPIVADRRRLIETYSETLSQTTSDFVVSAGKQHFQKSCSQCHQLDGVGKNVGAGLKQLSDKTPEQLLVAILDPNREVDPRFVRYVALLDSDKTIAGVIESENSSQLTMVESGGRKTTLDRDELVSLKSQGDSLMPVGFEEQLSPQQMFELISYLRSNR